ncbi:hypothetical protein ROLI_015670 [Roseobacter fucihabitans]|uniref:Uncharacterized protein n=1 Tax=Roseobacter fucihabitans TaxID=1537242 RepID=A0ABZ2BR51_9RHOB|nr:hypothetical protein [Roseobacter litoralis]MBC6965390.1 hypothetical protein [Roseobacter litoralis]
MVRRPTSRRGLDLGSVLSGTRLRDLGGLSGVSARDRERLERIIKDAGDLSGIRAEDLVISRDKPPVFDDLGDFIGNIVKPREVTDLLEEVVRQPVLSGKDPLHGVTTSLMARLRKKRPEALPQVPVATGKKGAEVPVSTKGLTQLLRLAAVRICAGEPSVIWDDGINQLIVHGSKISATVTDGMVRIDIKVEADGLSTTMQIPFALGSEERLSGLVMATTDRPAGNALVAQVWGDALIALAHGALVAVSESLAGASGRDVINKRLVPRALRAKRGSLVVESQARFLFKEDGR